MGKELEKTFFQIIHTYDQQVFGTLINITNNTFNNVIIQVFVMSSLHNANQINKRETKYGI